MVLYTVHAKGAFYTPHIFYTTPLPVRVEWLSTFMRFSGIFLGGQFQKRGKFRSTKFSVLKNQIFLLLTIFRILPFTSKNNRQEENSKLKIIFKKFPKMVKTVFDLYRGKQNLFGVSLQCLPVNKLQNKFCFRCNLQKC